MTAKEDFAMKKNYKLVPPDGGYGYVIMFAAATNFMSTTMFNVCFGMIYNDFFIQMGMSSTSINLLTGINTLCVAVSGFLSGPLLKTMSKRKLALVGSAFFNLGMLGTVFVNTQAQLFICLGLLQNTGLGFLLNVSCTMLNEYFVKKLLFATSIAQTLPAAAAMVSPMIISWAKTEYGFRGTLIVVLAFGLHSFVASALMQPVAWHMRKELVDDVPEKKLLLQIGKSVEFNNKVLQTPVVNLTDIENADLVYEEKESKPSIRNVVVTWIKDFLDWPLLKKFALTCGCLGPSAAVFVDFTYVFFLAQALYDLKWDNDQVKWALALLGSGDMAGRILLTFFSSWFSRLGNHPIYVIGLLIAITTKLGMLWVTNYTWTLVIIAIMGLSRCTIAVLIPLVVADSVKPEEFPSAMGIYMMMLGFLAIVMGPVVGAIRDATRDYTTMFLVLIGLLIAITVAWFIELLRAKRKTICMKELKL